ncbi:MAG: hypothetical protein J2P25_04200 [Nocardiopsaceae bacterium]|nr:hypothetical protein [Nocardiopsaceae bacterium]
MRRIGILAAAAVPVLLAQAAITASPAIAGDAGHAGHAGHLGHVSSHVPTVTVNAAAPFRAVTHVAAGGLYALARPGDPANSLLYPLHLNSVVQMAPGGKQLPNGEPVPAGDALVVNPSATDAGANEIVRMPDIYPNFPYKWVSWPNWLSKVDQMVRARLRASNDTNIAAWELWNEPDWTWDTSAAGPFDAGWVRTYREVRKLDTITPIQGPSISRWDESYMRNFLSYAKAHHALPDVISWHELGGPDSITADVAACVALEKSLKITPRPISIEEYGTTSEINDPGSLVPYLARFERSGVTNAERAFWYEYGTVDGLVTVSGVNGTTTNQPTGTWWLYKWYGDMTGSMVTVTPPAQSALDGLASYDPLSKTADIIVGGASGTTNVTVSGIGALGSSVRALVESTSTPDRFTAEDSPHVVSQQTLTDRGGRVTVQIPGMDADSAYRVLLRPADGSGVRQLYYAANASIHNAAIAASPGAPDGYYVGDLTHSGDARDDSFVDFLVNVPTGHSYAMTVDYANPGRGDAALGLAYDGGPWQTLAYPPTGNGWGTITRPVRLHAGYNVIRLAMGAPSFAGGSGVVHLGSIHLRPQGR